MKNGAYVLASETCALDVVGAELVRNIRPGEIIVVNDHGYKIVQYTNNTQLAICSMEYIYFARPDSDIYASTCTPPASAWAHVSPPNPRWRPIWLSACRTPHCPPHPAMRKQQACPTKWV